MKNRVSVSQLSLLLLLVVTGGKFLSLPSILAKDVGHDSWLVLCLCFAADAICLCFVLWSLRLNSNNLGLQDIFRNTVNFGGKLVFLLFFVIFTCRVVLLLDSCYNTFAVTFDVHTNWILFVLPIFLLAAFAISRGFNAVARVGQLLFALVMLSIVALLIYPTTQANFSALLPVGEAGFGKIASSAFARSFWFCDYVFIYFVLEDVTLQKRLFAPVLTTFFVGAILTVLLNVVFVCLFGQLAQYNSLAMSKIGLFSVAQSTNGRWDWITLTVWLTSVVLKIVIFSFCAYKCVEKFFNKKFLKPNFVVLGAMAVLWLVPMFLPVTTLVETFVHWCAVPFALVQYLLPLVLPLLTKIANAKVKVEEVQVVSA